MSRKCGSCSLCCKIMAVPEIKPDDNDWCPHCTKTAGCAIYELRPRRCRDFSCMWLMDERFGDHWQPQRAKIVINSELAGKNAYIGFVVDPAWPLRWREEPWLSDIKKVARMGINGTNGQFWKTFVVIKGEHIPIRGEMMRRSRT